MAGADRNGTVDRRDVSGAISRGPGPQVRRLAVAALPNVRDSGFQQQRAGARRRTIATRWCASNGCASIASSSPPPTASRCCRADRHGSPRSARRDRRAGRSVSGTGRCGCGASRRRSTAVRPASRHARARGVSWHARAHALTALARVDPGSAQAYLRRDSSAPGLAGEDVRGSRRRGHKGLGAPDQHGVRRGGQRPRSGDPGIVRDARPSRGPGLRARTWQQGLPRRARGRACAPRRAGHWTRFDPPS